MSTAEQLPVGVPETEAANRGPRLEAISPPDKQAPEWQAELSDKIAQLDDAARRFVQTRPALSALCALGAGFLASVIFAKLEPSKKKGSDDK